MQRRMHARIWIEKMLFSYFCYTTYIVIIGMHIWHKATLWKFRSQANCYGYKMRRESEKKRHWNKTPIGCWLLCFVRAFYHSCSQAAFRLFYLVLYLSFSRPLSLSLTLFARSVSCCFLYHVIVLASPIQFSPLRRTILYTRIDSSHLIFHVALIYTFFRWIVCGKRKVINEKKKQPNTWHTHTTRKKMHYDVQNKKIIDVSKPFRFMFHARFGCCARSTTAGPLFGLQNQPKLFGHLHSLPPLLSLSLSLSLACLFARVGCTLNGPRQQQ